MSPVERSSGHAGKALIVAAVGVVVAIGAAFAVAVLDNRGTVEVRLGDDVARVGRVDETAASIAKDGPILQPDLAGGDRDIVVQHLGDDPEDGWLALAARPTGAPRSCVIEWQDDDNLFRLLDNGQVTEECDGREFAPDGGELPQYEVIIQDGRIFVDLWSERREDD